ncbi:RNA 2'-phosphotransferase [Deinococcus sp. Marseille-Q6407]|uniref:RNA 2'-phosphotransferase n=1 Tax=Deinococcus sp. Marseille-Q6407 TaxID=2969223 RepID=UPI0021C1D696|nr:RNA 2'-phosphotransferase [Deinococcus sp. Marseille-Q6407]
MNAERLSKRLAYLLRHAPHEAGLTLERGGWVPLAPLLAFLNVSRAQVEQVVRNDAKGRYSLSPDGQKIRANQGHSVPVDLGLEPQVPPATLYHGSYQGARVGIARQGLKAMNRHHVHLSADTATALSVGLRRGWPLLFAVDAGRMHAAGFTFYRSDNGVWLVDAVPTEYLTELPAPGQSGRG